FSVLYVVYSGGHDQFSGFQFIGCDDAASVTHQAHYGYFAAAHLIVGRGVYNTPALPSFCRMALQGTDILWVSSLSQRMVTIVFMPGEGTGCLSATSCRRMVYSWFALALGVTLISFNG